MRLNLKLSQDFWYWPTIQLRWSNSNFQLQTCVSIDHGQNTAAVSPMTPAGTATVAGGYKCDINSDARTITILHNAPIKNGTTVSYNVTIINPTRTNEFVFHGYVFHRYNLNLTDYVTNVAGNSITEDANAG
jgi:acetyltransferase-like isoleucine patch superfamily enzyme